MTSVSVLAPEAKVKTGGSSGAPQAAQADRPRRPDHDHVAAQIVARLIERPRRAVVLAEDETHLNPLPHVRASWRLRTARPQIPTRARTGRSPCSARSR
jgi:hypothetical protein